MSYRGRFAPSPTGDLHLGSVATALVAWLRARAAGGSLLLRVEDIDTPRVVQGCEAQQLDDLRWLGLEWDEGPDCGGAYGPYRQSQRSSLYEAAIAKLAAQGLVYLCDCSRGEIARVGSAPHVGEEGPIYPGTCRGYGMIDRAWKRPPAVRLRVPDREIVVHDALQGDLRQHVGRAVGDFVLKRGDGIYAYQLAVVVDDLAMHISEVVRGFDLLSSAPRQILLAELLGGSPPSFAHVPMVVDIDGVRLQKRNPGHTVRGLRQQGVSAGAVLRRVACGLGLGGYVGGDGGLNFEAVRAGFDRGPLLGLREVSLST